MINHKIQLLVCLALILVLASCQTFDSKNEKRNQFAIDAIDLSQNSDKNTKEKVISNDEALSSLTLENNPAEEFIEDRFDVSVKNVDIHSFLLGLVDSTNYNLIVSPDLGMNISLQLKNVTVSEVLHALTKIYPVTVKQNDNLFFVSSAETMTAVYSLNYLNLIRTGNSKTRVAGQPSSGNKESNNSSSGNNNSGGGGDSGGGDIQQVSSSSIETQSETNFWQELTTSLNLIVKDEEKANIVVSPHAGLVVVRALPQTQSLIKNYLKSTQNSLERQVIIEAKIIEVKLNKGFQSGIDWSKMGTSGGDVYNLNQQGQILEQETKKEPLNGIFSLLYQGESFTAAIDLLQTQGDVQVLSSPRVSTVNNQKAIIKVGSDEYFVTDVSTTTVTGTSTATTPDVTLTPFFSGISLDVTPQVNRKGDIILHIHPIVSEVTDQPKTLSLGEDQFVLPLAFTNIRESDSIVRTRNGRVIVIGGLMQNTISEQTTSTPLLGDIPLLGNLFKQTRQNQVKSELVILLKAKLVDFEQMDNQLNQVKIRFSEF